jgi:folate-binding Fe-S cluster repair protein YgfZ
MLNLDLLGAVSFSKGCFPGQEIVARLKYRSTVKRRLFIASATASAQPGVRILRDDTPVGEILDCARSVDTWYCSAVVDVEATAGAPLMLQDGSSLALESPPYRLAR